ncbi:MAG: DnaD domain protein [Ruminococcus sp.]
MSYKIDFGGWGSVFAVPTDAVDKGLKLASDSQLKVLLYILRHSSESLTDETVSEALSLHTEDVRDAVEYWAQKGLLVNIGESISMPESKVTPAENPSEPLDEDFPQNNSNTPSGVSEKAQKKILVENNASEADQSEASVHKSRAASRVMKPEPAYVAKRLKTDKNLVLLMEEAQRILGKVLSNADTSTLTMLHDTDGLPIEVILMLMEYAQNIGKANMRFIEKTGMKWASEGITTIELAEMQIKRHAESSTAFDIVSTVFGMRNTGTPTKKQLEFAASWVNDWKFSEDMMRLAYERCVDKKGELNFSYINGILKRWYEQGLRNPDEVVASEQAAAKKPMNKKSQEASSQKASYDIDAYANSSMFDD